MARAKARATVKMRVSTRERAGTRVQNEADGDGETVQVRVAAGLGVATKTRKQSTVVACATFGLSTRSGLESESSTASYRIRERCLKRQYHCRVPLLTGIVQRGLAFLQHAQRSIRCESGPPQYNAEHMHAIQREQ